MHGYRNGIRQTVHFHPAVAGERRVQGENVRITAPAIKDLGFDQSKPGPAGDTAPKPEPPK